MAGDVHPESVLGRLREVPDPRSRRGRVYPLAAILGLLVAGALEGEGSLRGMWMRGKKHWGALTERLGIVGLPQPPRLTTVWYVVRALDVEALQACLRPEIGEEVLAVDGKHLRGSKREGKSALQVLAMAGQAGAQVLAQRQVEGGDEGAAAVEILSRVPLEGKVVSLDAGLMERSVVRAVAKKGGTTSG